MADYSLSSKSLLYGLSDFWLSFFKDTELLEYYFRGAEIQVGQAYLDLLSLILNNSVQDATVFNKEYFKLITIREDQVQFIPGVTANSHRYRFVLPDKLVSVPYLNNKILFPSEALEEDVSYHIGDDGVDRSLDFLVDPTNAYYELTVGSSAASIRVRSRFPGEDGSGITVFFNDNGSAAIVITRVGQAIQIDYDGPFSTGTHTAAAIVSAINNNNDVSPFILAEVVDAVGNASPTGTAVPTPLALRDSNPLDNFAVRKVTAYYGGSFTCALIPSWTAAGVRKGDILRLHSSKGIGRPIELDIDLLQQGKLYVNQNTPIPEANENNVDFTVLREPANNTSNNEPFGNSGIVAQSGINGSINPALRQYTAPTAAFSLVHEGDILRITTGNDAGAYEIVSVDSATQVTLAGANFTGNPVLSDWELHSVVSTTLLGASILSITNGVVVTDQLVPFTNAVIGDVLKLVQGTILYKFRITNHGTSGPNATLTVADCPLSGAASAWGVADVYTPTAAVLLSPPTAWPRAETLKVYAKRLLDGQQVRADEDYSFNADTGVLEARTVWETSLSNTLTYEYAIAVVQTVTPVQQGLFGALTSGAPDTFTAPDANFLPEHVGFALTVSNSSLTAPTNNGVFYIKAVLSSTQVSLTTDRRVAAVADGNNGSLVWAMRMRGSSIVESDSTSVNEIAFWAPDVLVDRFHLYNTFGYLINKYARSSENYRSLIRGVFQLFMLGPTLERFESAVNIIAGLQVIRENTETLLSYSANAQYAAVDGVFNAADSSFTSTSYTFTLADVGRQIYSVDGFNANRSFGISSIITANKVLISPVATTDTAVSWELRTVDTQQTVVTSRHTYSFARNVPIKSKFTDPANYGVLQLSLFEVISDIFTVTDYVETPRWWENATIPEELWVGESSTRRQSTSQLFENVVNPGDEGRVGDPGFIIGGSSDGFVPPSTNLRTGAFSDGTLLGDANYPVSNNVSFTSPTGNFTNADIGNILKIPGFLPVEEFRILAAPTATTIQVESFTALPLSTSALSWEIRTGTLALRNKAAYVILDQYLKQHLFTLTFNFATTSLIGSDVLTDLRNLVFQAKPSYTYLLLNPFALFDELIQVQEDFKLDAINYLGGPGGEIIAGNASPLLVIGSSWVVGQWFRQLELQGTFAAPAGSVTNVLGAPDPGYEHYINKFSIIKGPAYPDNIVEDHSLFTSAGTPIENAVRVPLTEIAPSAGAAITPLADGVQITVPVPTFNVGHLLDDIVISGSGLGNNGSYRIGVIVDAYTVHTYTTITAVAETGLTWALELYGDLQGQLKNSTGNVAIFRTQQTNAVMATPTLAGYHMRRPLISGSDNNPINEESYRLHSLTYLAEEGATVWLLYKQTRVNPIEIMPDAVGVLSGGNTLAVTSLDVTFSPSMCLNDRIAASDPNFLFNRFYVYFTGGPNAGLSAEITNYVDGVTAVLDLSVSLTADPAATFYVYHLQSYSVTSEVNSWEIIKPQVVLDKNTVDLSGTPAQDANTVYYRAYGVREPLDPPSEIFDDSLGDTLYHIGMPDPRPPQGRSRTGLDTDLREEPLQIARI